MTPQPRQAHQRAKAELLSVLDSISNESTKSIEDLANIGKALTKYLGALSPYWAKGGLFGRCGVEDQDKVAMQQVLTEIFGGMLPSRGIRLDSTASEASRLNYADLSYFTREKLVKIFSEENIGKPGSKV